MIALSVGTTFFYGFDLLDLEMLVTTRFAYLTLPIVILQTILCAKIYKSVWIREKILETDNLFKFLVLFYLSINVPNSFFFCFGRLDPEMQKIGYAIAFLAFASGSILVVSINIFYQAFEKNFSKDKVKVIRASLLNNLAHDSREGIISIYEGADYLINLIDDEEVDLQDMKATLNEIKGEARRVSDSMLKALRNERKLTVEHALVLEHMNVAELISIIENKLKQSGDLSLKVDLNETVKNQSIIIDRELAIDGIFYNLIRNAIKHTTSFESIYTKISYENGDLLFTIINEGEIQEEVIMLSKRGLKPNGRLGLSNLFFVADTLGVNIYIYPKNGKTIAEARFKVFQAEAKEALSQYNNRQDYFLAEDHYNL